ncbi:unnamed protein product, partial [Prorocentrum cordatum]
ERRRCRSKGVPAAAAPISTASRWGADPSDPRSTFAASEFEVALRTSPSEAHRRQWRGQSWAAPATKADSSEEAVKAAMQEARRAEVESQIANDVATLLAQAQPDDGEWQRRAAAEASGGTSEPKAEASAEVESINSSGHPSEAEAGGPGSFTPLAIKARTKSRASPSPSESQSPPSKRARIMAKTAAEQCSPIYTPTPEAEYDAQTVDQPK